MGACARSSSLACVCAFVSRGDRCGRNVSPPCWNLPPSWRGLKGVVAASCRCVMRAPRVFGCRVVCVCRVVQVVPRSLLRWCFFVGVRRRVWQRCGSGARGRVFGCRVACVGVSSKWFPEARCVVVSSSVCGGACGSVAAVARAGACSAAGSPAWVCRPSGSPKVFLRRCAAARAAALRQWRARARVRLQGRLRGCVVQVVPRRFLDSFRHRCCAARALLGGFVCEW
jgi:hypothetical protein